MKKIIALTTILSCIIINAFAQGEFGRVTPQTADFMRYGETSVSLNTGSFSSEVPVFTIKTVDFSMPISLCYNSDGFKPNKRPSCVGNNWFLNAGGSITREIYLAPDDAVRTTQSDVTDFDLTGFNVCRKSGVSHTKESLYNLSSYLFQSWSGVSYIPYDGHWEDTMPDLFSFNVCGHSGSFVIGNDGNVMVSDKAYKVDISKMTNQPYKYNTADPGLPQPSQITITAPDGIVFTFGNMTDLSAIEFSRSFDNQNVPEGRAFFGPATINGWHLTSIITPHNTEVNFNYYNPDLSGYTPYNANNESSSIWQTTMALIEVPNPTTPEATDTKKTYSETKSVCLESIVVNDGTEVVFSKSREGYNFYPTSGYCGVLTMGTKYDRPMFQLDDISIKYYGKKIHQYELKYDTKLRVDNGAGLRFLKDVIIDNLYSYNFTYDHPTDNKYPDPVFGPITDGDGYMPYSTNGVLTQINYPTGGYTFLKYEKHDFGKRVDKYSSDKIHISNPSLNDNPPANIIGGLRIARVENHDADNNLLSFKEYYYVSDTVFPVNRDVAKKSGIYLHHPPFFRDLLLREIAIGSTVNSFSKNYNISEPHIAYSHILEYNGDEMGYKCYSFTDYEDYPDIDDRNVSSNAVLIRDALALAGMNKQSSCSRKRGLLKETKYYNINGLPVGYEKNIYNSTQKIQPADPIAPELFEGYVIGVHPISGGAIAMKIALDRLLVQSKEVKTGSNSPVKTTSFEYNDYNLLNKETLKNSDGKQTVVTTKYACDKTGGVYIIMKNLNLISFPVEVVTQVNGSETEKQSIVYKSNGKDIAEKYISLRGAALQKVATYDLYDERGRLLQATDKKGIVSSYIWRDDLLQTPIEERQTIHYPVAEVVNATYNTVNQIIENFLTVGSTGFDTHIDYTNIGILREKIPNAFITTYSYKPLVGISTTTDPRGATTYYEYDDFNRLKETYIIENGTKKVLQKYDYHFANQ